VIKQLNDKILAEFGLSVSTSKEETDAPPYSSASRVDSNENTTDLPDSANSIYPGDAEDDEGPWDKETGYRTLAFKTPAQMLAVVVQDIATQQVTLHDWQLDISQELADSLSTASSKHPYKYALCAANGSGKDAFVVAHRQGICNDLSPS